MNLSKKTSIKWLQSRPRFSTFHQSIYLLIVLSLSVMSLAFYPSNFFYLFNPSLLFIDKTISLITTTELILSWSINLTLTALVFNWRQILIKILTYQRINKKNKTL